MPHEVSTINAIGNINGSHNKIQQFYVPGSTGIRPQNFTRYENVTPFSVDWLVFSQKTIPVLGRKREFQALTAFLAAPAPFSWWVIVGDGGTGKSRLALEATEHLPEGWEGESDAS
jgi:hypothetical protein